MDNLVQQLRREIDKCNWSYQYENALFYSETLFSTMRQHPKDQYCYADTLFKLRQFRRAIDFIKMNNLHSKLLTFKILYARCLFAIKEPVEALDTLDIEFDGETGFDKNELEYFGKSENELVSEICYLLGQIHESIENVESATELYKKAVKYDIKCYCAVRRLYGMHCLTSDESEQFLLNELNWNQSGVDTKLLHFLKSMYLDMFSNIKFTDIPERLQPGQIDDHIAVDRNSQLVDNHRMRLINRATRLFNTTQFRKCLDVLTRIVSVDHYDPDVIVLYASVLKQLNKKNDLYIYAYELIEKFPQKKESWYSLGCYNFLIGKLEQSVRCFNKASMLDRDFGYAWLALGHVLSAKNQRDQALRAYVSAGYLIRGSHKPDLYIAIEYSMSRNMDLCNKFLTKSGENGGLADPYFWHEKGYIHYMNKEYETALDCFSRAEQLKRDNDSIITRFWDTLISNRGHCLYKLQRFTEAESCFQRVLLLSPGSISSHKDSKVMLALIQARRGSIQTALTDVQLLLSRHGDNGLGGLLGGLASTLLHWHAKIANASGASSTTADLLSKTGLVSDQKIRTVIMQQTSNKCDSSALSHKKSQQQQEGVIGCLGSTTTATVGGAKKNSRLHIRRIRKKMEDTANSSRRCSASAVTRSVTNMGDNVASAATATTFNPDNVEEEEEEAEDDETNMDI